MLPSNMTPTAFRNIVQMAASMLQGSVRSEKSLQHEMGREERLEGGQESFTWKIKLKNTFTD